MLSAGDVTVEVGGETLLLMPERAAFVRSSATLLVSDLHWGKAETMAAYGMASVPGVLEVELARLAGAAERVGAKRVVVVGDLVHAQAGLTRSLSMQIEAFRERFCVPMQLVTGNHDARVGSLPKGWEIEEVGYSLSLGTLLLRHVPPFESGVAVEAERLVVSGHVHPCVTVGEGASRVRARCFWLSREVLLLPAFSDLAGGASPPREGGARMFAVLGDAVVEVPGVGASVSRRGMRR